MFVFSFALFIGENVDHYAYYRDRTLEFLQNMSKRFPGCSFVAHLLDTVPREDAVAIVAAAQGRATIHRYSFTKKRGVYWLVGAMRFRTLWEHDGPETVSCAPKCVGLRSVDLTPHAQVVVLDIHDDIRIQAQQVPCGVLCEPAWILGMLVR